MDEKQWIMEIIGQTDKEYKITDKQARILEVAIQEFADKGYSNTSTSEIASKAGVAEGTIFRHYKTKKELLLAIVTPTLTKGIAPIIERTCVKDIFNKEYESFEDFLRFLLNNRYQFLRSRAPIMKILLQEAAFHDEINADLKRLFTNRVYQEFTKIIAHFQDKGQLKIFPTDTVIRLMLTSIVGFLVTRFIILPGYKWDDAVEVENTVAFIMSGLKA
ncbi:MAG: TetR/AcrR family transcriptional regulator [Clostridia bacterium]|nr:TetR/AcrR family transcriptional regulator [Clostridia bacterium]